MPDPRKIALADISGPIAAAASETKAALRETLGIGNVDNTSDADKPISTLVATALAEKATTAALTAGLAAAQPLSAALTGTTASFTTAKDTKLTGIATGATANSTDATLLARANHTGTQAQSTVTNLTTDLAGKQPLAAVLTGTTASFTTAQETKLAGIASGATANSSDATLLARANHTGTQAQSTVTNLVSDLAARVTTAGLPSAMVAASGVSLASPGEYALTISVAGGVGTATAEPLIIPATATCLDILANTASGLADQAVALDRWLHNWQSLPAASAVVTYNWPSTLTPDVPSNSRTVIGDTAITFGIASLTPLNNPEIFAADKRHMLRFELDNSGGSSSCAVTFTASSAAQMALEWGTGFSNPSIAAGSILTINAAVSGNRAVLTQAVRSRPVRTVVTSNSSSGIAVTLGNSTTEALLPGDIVAIFGRSTTSTIPTVPGSKGYTAPAELTATTTARALRVVYKTLEAADISAGTFASGSFTGSGRTWGIAIRGGTGVGVRASSAATGTTFNFSPLPGVIDPAMIVGFLEASAENIAVPAGTTERSLSSNGKLFVTTTPVSSWAPTGTTGLSGSWVEAALEIL